VNRRPVLAALAAALVLAPVACSGGSAPTAASPSPSGAQSELEATRRFAQCARTHGYPAFPDPVVDERSRVTFSEANRAAGVALKRQLFAVAKVPACKGLYTEMQRMHTPLGRQTAMPNAAAIQQLQRFAQCIREHGIPNWPDPKSDGSFSISGLGLGDPKKSPTIRTATNACNQYHEGAAANFVAFS
jgi:hypothetical protein